MQAIEITLSQDASIIKNRCMYMTWPYTDLVHRREPAHMKPSKILFCRKKCYINEGIFERQMSTFMLSHICDYKPKQKHSLKITKHTKKQTFSRGYDDLCTWEPPLSASDSCSHTRCDRCDSGCDTCGTWGWHRLWGLLRRLLHHSIHWFCDCRLEKW